ncbi:MAG: hypothetical protein JWM16_4453, partial [Verrucomicrobiales bacterium]|nr:hypothetical protein [Verrucomicrobiales bacterium]
PVTAGHWQVQPSEKALTLLGYNRTKLLADTTAANVSGLVMALSRARGEMQMVFFFPNGSFGNGTSGQMSYPTHLQYYYALYNLMDVNVPTNVFFSGPAGSGLANTASAVFGASFQGDSIWYSSPQINVPQYPPGGVYTVNYKNQPQQFAVPDPGAAIRQVVLQPSVSVSVSNVLQQISWTYRDLNGAALPAPDFMASISIRIDGIGGRLYDTDLSPGQTSHVPVQSVIWSNVTSIQMVYNDNLNNQYVTFWDRGLQPLQILSSVLPAGSAGVSYHYFPIGAGGLAPYSWSLITSNLPAGLTFTPVTGEIGGIPSTPGNSSFTIRVQDQSGQALERNLSLAVGSGSPPLSLQPLPVAGPNQFGMRVFGENGHSYQLQASSNLLDWIPLFTTNGSGVPLDLLDSHATNHSQFYRILRTP